MFEKKSRYAGMQTYEVLDRRGRRVLVTRIPPAPAEGPLGEHLLKQGQRLDHLAFRYMGDAAGFWRICELNGVMHAEALTEAQTVQIPEEAQVMGIGATIAADNVPDPALTEASVIEVEERMGQTTSYRVRYDVDIADGDVPLLISNKLDPGKVLSVLVPYGDTLDCIVKGPIQGQEVHLEHGGAGSSIDVRGTDTTSEMDRETRAAVWSDVTDSAAVTSILSMYSYIADVENTKSAHLENKHALVQRDTDLGFVRRLARRNGCSFWVTCNELGLETAHFKRPVLDGEPEAVLTVNVENPSINALDLSWELDSPTSVVGVQLDLNTLKEIDGSVDQTPLSVLGNVGQKSISGVTRSGHFNAPVDDVGDLKARGEGALIESDWFLRANCEASLERLGTVVRAHTVVELRGLGSRYSGRYLVAAVRHMIDATAHRMNLELVRNGWGGNGGS